MKRLLILTFAILMITSTANAYSFAENWTKKDTAWQATFLTVTIIDFMQTRWMASKDWRWDGKRHTEFCPVFSDHPNKDAVNIMIPLGMAAHTLIALALPPAITIFDHQINPRRIWQSFWVYVEITAVGNNIYNGVGLKYEF